MTQIQTFDIEALPVRVDYVAEVPSPWDESKKNKCDEWRISIETKAGYWSTGYWTGSGLRETIRGVRAMSMPGNKFVKGHWQATKPVKPKIADVMYSLFMDASAADENFHDWCDNFGLSSDSISALNTYKKCLEIATALRRHFNPETRAAIQSVIEEM
jgi:hypothetical protein